MGRGKGKKSRNPHQKAKDRKRESKLRADGVPLRAIAEEVGLSYEQVRKDLLFIDARLLAASKDEIETAKAQTLAKLRYAQVQAVRGYERSFQAVTQTIESSSPKGSRETIITSEQPGRGEHLRNYVKAVEAEAKLLGLYEKQASDNEELTELERLLAENLKVAIQEHGSAQDLPLQSGAVSLSDPLDSPD